MPYWTISSFSLPLTPETSSVEPNNLLPLDVNGDGFDDIVVANGPGVGGITPAVPITVLLSDGLGGFTDATSTVFPGGIPLSFGGNLVSLADFNSDGRLDVFLAELGYDAGTFPGMQNTLLLSSGANGFVDATATLPQLADYTHSSSSGDVNGDGFIDIFVNNQNHQDAPGEESYLLINDGFGQFTRSDALSPTALSHSVSTCLIFDADGDGVGDLYVGANGSGTIILNPGDGDFSAAIEIPVVGPIMQNTPAALAAHAADLNGDGALDLVIVYNDSPITSHALQILINDGGGHFTDETAQRLLTDINGPNAEDSGKYSANFTFADLNGDGHTDIILRNGQSRKPILLNDGAGHFIQLPASFIEGFTPDPDGPDHGHNYTVMDANNDGRLDLFVMDSHSAAELANNFDILMQQDPGASQAGGADADALLGDESNETLSGLAGDDVIFGAAGVDTLNGGDDNDYLNGGAGIDTLSGGAGVDTLNGGTGADTMNGGDGNDTYVVNTAGDVTTEISALGGIDLVQSSVTRTLGANIENLTLTGSAINGIGNTLANVLTGNSVANTLTGDAGADTLNGGGGADTMVGGDGNDTYVVNTAGDVTTEISSTGGTDLVQSSVTRTLGAHLENLTLTGGLIIDGTGNTLNNVLTGNNAANALFGLGGADTLNGGTGADIMRGGGGNDIYVVDNAGDTTIETSAASGLDLVQSSITRTLGAHLEKLTLTGLAVINGTGNTLANLIAGNNAANTLSGLDGADRLFGGAGGDRLIGGAGLDILTGNSGADKFVFNSAPAAADRDTITDYNVAADTIQIDDAAFVGIGGPGVLGAAAFHIGASAADASDRIVYNAATGALYFDANGIGGAAQIQFATLSAGLLLTNADFVVI